MECEEFLRDYSDFLDRRFEEHPIVSYCDHLLGCSDCAEYDRVVRRGLELLRGLERPETQAGLVPRVSERVLGSGAGRRAERERTVLVAAAAALALFVAGSLAMLDSGPAELPPVVVEPVAADELPSLWGPAPTFTSSVSLLRVPDLADDGLLRPPGQRLSLFRAPLKASRRTPFQVAAASPE